ncbi:MAG: penicillin-binding protein activator [Desulfuromonadaceae bacterium]|nr:penicillin-binding protein activator [Desulfuromonadaceae bacterium]
MPIQKKLGVVIFLLWCISWSGVACAIELSAAAPQVLHQATAFEQTGDTERALSLLRQYVLENPDSAHVPTAYAHLSRILEQQGRFEQAHLYAQRIPVAEQQADLVPLVRASLRRNDNVAAANILDQVDEKTLDAAQLREYLQVQAELALQRGELMQTLIYCARLMELETEDGGVAAFAGSSGMQALERMPETQLEEAAFMFADTPVAALLTLHELRKYTGAPVERDSDIYYKGEQLVSSDSHAWVRRQALVWLDQVDGKSWQRRAVGVVLPLSGRYAPFGRMVQQGIELAAQLRGADAPELIVRDSRADVMHTEQIVRELIQTHRVMAVIGPMMGEPAARAAEVAQQEKVPIILLSHWEGLPQLGSYVFRHSLTAKQQAYALASYAVSALQLQTFAMLQPENKLGDDFTRHFRNALKLLGGEVLYHRHYAPGSTDFRAALAPMVPEEVPKSGKADDSLSAEESSAQAEPEVKFEALFIPDFADTIALLAPQLAFSSIENVQLLGINGWNSPELLSQAGRYVRDAIFTDGFDPESSDIFVQRFVTQYRKRYSAVPTILEAQGYDVANLLLDLLLDARVENPRQVQRLLQQVDYAAGVSGLRGFDAEGEALREIMLFKFGIKNISRLDLAPLPVIDTLGGEDVHADERSRTLFHSDY